MSVRIVKWNTSEEMETDRAAEEKQERSSETKTKKGREGAHSRGERLGGRRWAAMDEREKIRGGVIV